MAKKEAGIFWVHNWNDGNDYGEDSHGFEWSIETGYARSEVSLSREDCHVGFFKSMEIAKRIANYVDKYQM